MKTDEVLAKARTEPTLAEMEREIAPASSAWPSPGSVLAKKQEAMRRRLRIERRLDRYEKTPDIREPHFPRPWKLPITALVGELENDPMVLRMLVNQVPLDKATLQFKQAYALAA